MSETHELIRQLSAGIDRLTAEVARLRRDIANLHSRIEPFEDEVPRQSESDDVPLPKFRNLKDELDRLEGTRRTIRSCEFHLNAMRAKMDEISNDAISRDEIKPWLKGSQ